MEESTHSEEITVVNKTQEENLKFSDGFDADEILEDENLLSLLDKQQTFQEENLNETPELVIFYGLPCSVCFY